MGSTPLTFIMLYEVIASYIQNILFDKYKEFGVVLTPQSWLRHWIVLIVLIVILGRHSEPDGVDTNFPDC